MKTLKNEKVSIVIKNGPQQNNGQQHEIYELILTKISF
jgi:hypothetical protein